MYDSYRITQYLYALLSFMTMAFPPYLAFRYHAKTCQKWVYIVEEIKNNKPHDDEMSERYNDLLKKYKDLLSDRQRLERIAEDSKRESYRILHNNRVLEQELDRLNNTVKAIEKTETKSHTKTNIPAVNKVALVSKDEWSEIEDWYSINWLIELAEAKDLMRMEKDKEILVTKSNVVRKISNLPFSFKARKNNNKIFVACNPFEKMGYLILRDISDDNIFWRDDNDYFECKTLCKTSEKSAKRYAKRVRNSYFECEMDYFL